MNLLVTGGAGFIGSNFIIYILNKYKDYRVVNLDKLTYAGDLANLKEIEDSANYFFVQGDIADRDLVEKVMEKYEIDHIINFAAETHVDRSIENSEPFIYSNVFGTQVLLDVAKKFGVEKYYQISTDEVYGDLPLNTKEKFTETTPLNPRSPYSASKASADMLCHSYFTTYGLPVVISRCSNNYGPRQFPEKLIPFFIKKALAGEKLPVYGDGLNVRDWICVIDHVHACDSVLHNGKIGEVYNIGGNNEISNLDLTKKILTILGKSENLIEFVDDRPGHDRRYAMDCGKIEKELGFRPEINFEEGLIDTIEWYSN
jgi:dTDP-glucose 4,6-dehydratase